MSKTIRMILGAVLILSLFAACQPKAATQEAPAEPAQTEAAPAEQPAVTEAPAATQEPVAEGPKSGGTLRMSGYYGIIDSLNPLALHEATSIMSVSLIYSRLFRIAADGESLEGDAVDSYTISEDGLVYSFHLRPGLTFADGTPVTMDDVIFSLTQSMTTVWWAYPQGTTLAAVDDENFTLTLVEPFAPFLDYLGTYYTSIVPKALVEAQGEAFFQKPIGSGPFMVKEWTSEYLALQRNPYYYEEGKPYLDEIIIYPGSDDNTRMLKFMGGELDVNTSVPYSQAATADALQGATVRVDPIFSVKRVLFFLGIPPFEDINVRKALNYATDRQAIIDTVLFGYGEPAYTPISKVMYHNDNLSYEFDLDKARELMAQSAYPDGFETTLYYISGDTTDQQVAVLLQQQWAALGVTVNIETAEMFTLWDMEPQGLVPLEIDTVTSGILDPSQNSNFYVCAFHTQTTKWCNEELDALLVEANKMMDPVEREAAYMRIQELGFEDAPVVPLFHFPALTAVYDYVKDFKVLPTNEIRLWEVWLDK